MRQRRGWFGPLLVLLVLLHAAHAVLTGLGRQLAVDVSDYDGERLTDALRLVRGRDHAGHGVVEVVGSGARVSSRAIVGNSGPLQSGYYIFDVAGEARATAAAMGVDREHHIVSAYLVGFVPFATDNLWLPLMTLSRRKDYQLDSVQYWGHQDIWQTSAQAFARTRGDCEDHALALADWLIGLGQDARVVIGTHRGGGHAWVVLFKDGEQYLFEATQKQGLSAQLKFPLARLMTDYRPQYMFNREHFWTNTGSALTTDYGSPRWVRKSRYLPEI